MCDGTLATGSISPLHQPIQCSNSQLLQLPTEIRRPILLELLFSTNPLGNASAMDESDLFHASRGRQRPTRRTFKFYPAILQVCRMLYCEGYDILYKENTLSIYVGLQGIPQITILDNRIRVWATDAHKFQDALDHMQDEESHDKLIYARSLRQIPHILDNMSNVQLTIVAKRGTRLEPPDRGLHDFCYFMQEALQGKSIEVLLIQPWLPDCLRAFSIFRCPQFIIRSWRTDGENSRWVAEHHDFYNMIMGSEPVYDTVRAYDEMAVQLERDSHEGATWAVSHVRARLYERALSFDQSSFTSAAEDVLQVASNNGNDTTSLLGDPDADEEWPDEYEGDEEWEDETNAE